MQRTKIIAGAGCLIAAFFLGIFAWMSFVYGNSWFIFIPAFLTLSLIVSGIFLLVKRHSSLSKLARVLIGLAMAMPLIGALMLNRHIRHDRKMLQIRAQEFLARPVPKMLNTNSIGGNDENSHALVSSRTLVERYANNGRIRWSAQIQGQFATVGLESCTGAANTNEEARLYLADCQAILDDEWRMGFWQWVEDTMEMKSKIPEIEEEDAPRIKSPK